MDYAIYTNKPLSPIARERNLLSDICHCLNQKGCTVIVLSDTPDRITLNDSNVEHVMTTETLLKRELKGVFCLFDERKSLPTFVEECRQQGVVLWSLNNTKTYNRVVDWVGNHIIPF